MKIIYELIITAMETLGLLFVAAGIGLFASWIAGVAGFFTVTGAGLLTAAYLAARQQTAREAAMRPSPVLNTPPPNPATRNAGDIGVDGSTQHIPVTEANLSLRERIKKAFDIS